MNYKPAIAVALLAAVLTWIFNKHYFFPVSVPKMQSGYFGPGEKKIDDSRILPFKINVPDEVLQDLNDRLDKTRFYTPLENTAFQYGVNTDYMKEVKNYWRNKYDWRKAEATLNSFPNFMTQIEGINVHFMRVKPPPKGYKQILPLLIVHGWPGSVYEFYKILPMLTDPKKYLDPNIEFAFEVVAPSIPGYGWSEAPYKKGFNAVAAARVFDILMSRLNINKYFCQGGDWGSMITTVMAQHFPDRVVGLHTNMATVSLAAYPTIFIKMVMGLVVPSLMIHPADHKKVYPMGEKFLHILQETGYMHIQATKPDTVGFSLNDSPLGLAAYILEKFSTWTNPLFRQLNDGGLSGHFTMDELLTNVMVYWTTNSIATSQRFYKEYLSTPDLAIYDAAPVLVPTGISCFPHELLNFPKNFLQYRYLNITTFTEMPRGGHFPAFEVPELLAGDVFRFVRQVMLRAKQARKG